MPEQASPGDRAQKGLSLTSHEGCTHGTKMQQNGIGNRKELLLGMTILLPYPSQARRTHSTLPFLAWNPPSLHDAETNISHRFDTPDNAQPHHSNNKITE